MTESPKTLKEATKYLYFDDVPTSQSSNLGVARVHDDAPKAKIDHLAEESTHMANKATKKAAVKSTHDVELGEKPDEEQKVAEQISSSSTMFMEGLDTKFEEFFAAAEPHKTTIMAGVGVAGIVAAAVVLQRRRRRHKREADLDSAGVAADDEFEPLLVKKRTPSSAGAAGYGYGAM